MAEPSIVIVGGGAGGLELAARLGRAMGPRRVVLVDMNESHIWKPSLHEVAAGTLDIHREDLSYFMLARDCGFTFMQGELKAVDRGARRLQLAAVLARDGEEVFPARALHYGVLVLAVGSRSNFFGVPGAAEHAITVDSTAQAEHLRQRLLRQFVRWKQDKAGSLPARAQVAHQQASYLYRQLMAPARREAWPQPAFYFRDYGSLVSIGHSRGVGALVGILSGRSWLVQGLIARLMYMSLHLTHHAVVLGPTRTLLLALGRLLLKRTAPRVKLH